ncbi:uncharacterized protein tbc1d10c isoform X2 [Scleropages formosus]|uniref:TBC1 domain family, member 10C n=2 Tax=Scleropages formosus TaxID=113540 RepID=A0A8C9T0M9_SCLFO|nr:uncharacterized protein LOC108935905 isoform X2 [Scleropages formosus]
MDAVTQSDFNSEESSGSDALSSQSISIPATETDRFGFLLGTGSTVGEGPPPEVVRQRETKWLNIMSQWDRFLTKKTNKVKDQCRKGIPASLRARCWPLLCRATERKNQNEALYEKLDKAPALQSWVDVIERDIDRQFPFHEMFLSKDGHGQRGLFRVLKAYTQFRPDEGYCQAQGPVAAVLLMIMPAEEAFWCLVQISEQYLPGYYSPLLEGVLFDAGILNRVLRKACPPASKHLKKHGVEPLMFATDWLMCLYTRHLPFNTLLRVWDLFFCYGVRVLFQVAVVLVRRSLGRQEQRDECEGQMETLERLRSIKDWISQEDDAFIEEVCSVSLSDKDLERETEKEMEKWKKERPSSTFNPWGRCHGYRAAWIKGKERDEELQRKEREKGNLTVPLNRSPSSLSPSFLRKLRRSSRAEMTEKEGNDWREEDRENKVLAEEPEVVTYTESNKEGHLSNDEDNKAQNVSADENKSLVEQRKPSVHSIEGAELNQNVAGDELNMNIINAGSPSENTKPHSCAANSSHALPGDSAMSTEDNDLREQTQDKPSQLALQTPTLDKTIQDVEIKEDAEQLGSLETGPEFSETTNCSPSEEHGILTGLRCNNNHSETVLTSSTSPIEHCQSEIPQQTTETSVQKSTSQEQCAIAEELNEVTVTGTQESNLHEEKQDIATEECNTVTDICTQSTTNEQSENLKGPDPNQNKMLEESKEQLVQDCSCTLEQFNKEIAEASDEAGELSPDENTTKQPVGSVEISITLCPVSKEIQESGVSFPISGETEVSRKTQSVLGELSENVEQMNPVSSGADMDEPSDNSELEDKGESSEQTNPVSSGADMDEPSDNSELEDKGESSSEESSSSSCPPGQQEHSNDSTKTEAFDIDSVNNQSVQESLITCDSCIEKSLSENLVAGESPTLEDTTKILQVSDLCLQTQGHTPSEASEGETTVTSKEEQNPVFQSAVTDETHETEPPESLPAATASTLGHEECKQFQMSDDDNMKEAQEPADQNDAILEPTEHTDLREVEATDPIPCNESNSIELQQSCPINQNEAQELESVKPNETVATASKNQAQSFNNQGSTVELRAETQINENVTETPQPCYSAQSSETTEDVEGQKENTKREGDTKDIRCSISDVQDTYHKEPSSTVPPRECTSQKEDETQKDEPISSTLTEPPLTTDDKSKSLKMSAEKGKSGGIAEYKLRKTSSSRTSHPRRLSEDTFKEPHSEGSQPSPCPEVFQDTDRHRKTSQSEHTDSPKRFGLFRRLRGDHAKDSDGGAKSKTKMTVPTIVIQDFSEVVEEPEEALNAKERRKRRREQERRQKEEEKARKKKEKELEKERSKERRKPQTRGKSFQVQSSSKAESVIPPQRNSSSSIPVSKRNSAPYFDTYF